MNVAICGMMGSGKTTVGCALAKALQFSWVDTDVLIEEKYGKISEIFQRHGEAYFRALETETVRGLSQKDGYVLSLGGGLVLKSENVILLKQSGKLVYLRAKKETLEARLASDQDRPLLHAGEETLSQKLDRLLKERSAIYEQVADFIVDVDGKTPQQIAEEICKTVGLSET